MGKKIIRDILVGLLIAIVGGVIVAWILREGRFQSQPSSAQISPLTIVIPATTGWSKSGLILQIGQSMFITANGNVDYNGFDETSGNSDPNGDGVPCDKANTETLLNQKFDIECLVSGVSYGALVGRVGDGAPFLIGSSHQFTTYISGELYLGVNDCCTLSDNSGEFKVTISSP